MPVQKPNIKKGVVQAEGRLVESTERKQSRYEAPDNEKYADGGPRLEGLFRQYPFAA